MLFYHSLNGDFVNAWYVSEGRNFHTCNPISFEDANLLSRSDSDCLTVTITTYYHDCITVTGYSYATYENEESNTQVFICSEYKSYTYSYQVCWYNSSSSGGAYIPTNDLSRVFGTCDNNLRDNLQGFLRYMESYDCASDAVLSYIENNLVELGVYNKMNVGINSNQTEDISYNSGTNTLYFKSIGHYSDLAMHEELVHSIQRVVYANYGEEPFNMEFEAKTIVDYARLSNGYRGVTDMSLNMRYAEVELKNGSTKTMADWLDDLSFSYFDEDDYLSYMVTWSSFAFNYKNYMMNSFSYPRLIFSIIDEINN